MKTLLEITYSGKNYHGWQVQSNLPTVQGCLQEVFERVCQMKCSLSGCSRTDAGVHANQFFCVAETELQLPIPIEKLPLVLNRFLPGDLIVKTAKIVDESFHPRFDAMGKEYEYRILNTTVPDPFLQGFAWWYPRPLLVDRMQEAAQRLVGKKDFTSFCSAATEVEDKVRTIFYCTVEKEGEMVLIRVHGDGFLYNMVRIIVGTLVGVSEGKYTPERLSEILLLKDRKAAGMTAPPDGLYLNRVFYPSKKMDDRKA